MKLLNGRVLEGYGSFYSVLHRSTVYSCTLRGKFRRILKDTYSPIAVGDRVRFSLPGGEYGVIEELLERRNKISRKSKSGPAKEKVIVANVDQIVAVVSVKSPPLKTGLIDRMLLVAEREYLKGIVCINKNDLARPGELDPVVRVYRKLRYSVFVISALTGEGFVAFENILKGKFSVFIGQSGTGKTSILNRLQPGLDRSVREISAASDKGKHATSFVSAVYCDFGGMIADSPGFRDFGLWGIDTADIDVLFREFRRYIDNCRYIPCSHTHEPGCAVRDAFERGVIAESRFVNYQRILESLGDHPA